jgi:hypothetical protein
MLHDLRFAFYDHQSIRGSCFAYVTLSTSVSSAEGQGVFGDRWSGIRDQLAAHSLLLIAYCLQLTTCVLRFAFLIIKKAEFFKKLID